MNNKGTGQTVKMCRLVCAFVVHNTLDSVEDWFFHIEAQYYNSYLKCFFFFISDAFYGRLCDLGWMHNTHKKNLALPNIT